MIDDPHTTLMMLQLQMPKVAVHTPNRKGTSPYPQLERGYSVSPTGKGPPSHQNGSFLSDMHNNTHKCTRNEGKACKQLM